MGYSCIVKDCKSCSTNQTCYPLSWHQLPKDIEALSRLQRYLSLPQKPAAHHRICSECMNKVPKPRKPPSVRTAEVLVLAKIRPTRAQMRHVVAHDHLYARLGNSSSYLSHVCQDEPIPLVVVAEPPAVSLEYTPSNCMKAGRGMFCIESFSNDDSAIQFYTSFPSYSHFMICFNFFGDSVNHIIYPCSSVDRDSDSGISRAKTQRSLTPENEFFLTLRRLRCGLMEIDLAYRYNISQSTVSRIFIAWVNFIYHKFKEIPIWPSQSQVQSLMPPQFKR